VKVRWTRDRSAEGLATAKHFVSYWVLAERFGWLIVIQGDVSARSADVLGRLLSDIDAIAVSMKVSVR
jgi:hypothetical protein